MKHSLLLKSVLLSGALLVSACSSGSGSSDDVTGDGDVHSVYSVRYFFENEEACGFEHYPEFDSEIPGIAFTVTDYHPEEFSGYAPGEVEQKTILPDGTTCLEVYYRRTVLKVDSVFTVELKEDIAVSVLQVSDAGDSFSLHAESSAGFDTYYWYVDGNYTDASDTDTLDVLCGYSEKRIHVLTVIAVDCDGETFSASRNFEAYIM